MKKISKVYKLIIASRSLDDDIARRESIFNILLFSFLILTLLAFTVSLVRFVTNTNTAEHASPLTSGIMALLILILYLHSRIKFQNYLIIIFLSMYFGAATMALYKFGYVLTQGLLIYVLVIVVSGILISSLASLVTTVCAFTSLLILRNMQLNGTIMPNTRGIGGVLNSADLTIYMTIFVIILLVSWLSSREIEASLKRAKISEALLKNERDNLEMRVAERTRELEQVQAKNIIELYRFAEFGRVNSSILHDLANPLTSLSINVNELATKSGKNEIIEHVQEGLEYMQRYVDSTLGQLRIQQTSDIFNSSNEIKRIVSLNKAKLERHSIECVLSLTDNVLVRGDSIKFDRLISNLFNNAIDSVIESENHKKKLRITSTTNIKKDLITIKVVDNGVGIPEDKMTTIFKPFYTTKSNAKGTGIGLTIVGNIIDDFKGTLTIKSNNNITIFKVVLPLSLESNI